MVTSFYNSLLNPNFQRVSSPSSRQNASESILIRAARLKDINTLAEILTHSFHPPEGWLSLIHPILKLGIYEDLRSRFNQNNSDYICLVAIKTLISATETYEEEILGTIEISLRSHSSFENVDDKYPYISNLAVSNSYRRQGIARKLLIKCDGIAQSWGYQKIFLHVLDHNLPAKKLYGNSGYKTYQIESGFDCWFFKSPKRLLLKKDI